jgi:hypothetical protein
LADIITKDRFTSGLTYSDYINGIETNQDEFVANYRAVTLPPEDQSFFGEVSKRLGGSVKALALAEDWCPDVVANLPIVARIAEAMLGSELRIFPRDENLDIMDQYLFKDKYRSVPTIIFFDQDFRELGRWVERPAAANRLRDQITQELTDQGMPEPELRIERGKRMRAAYSGQFRPETIREIREVLARAADKL